MFFKTYSLGRVIDISIITGGYLSFTHLFSDNLILTLLGLAVIAGEIYQLDLPQSIFKKDLEQLGTMHRYLRRLTVLLSFLHIVGGLLIMQGILALDFSLAVYGLGLLFIDILLIKHATDKLTHSKISRAKVDSFGRALSTLLFISILLGLGGHIVLSGLALLIAFNKTFVKRWNIIKKKNILKVTSEFSDQKEVEEKNLLFGWTNLDKSKQEQMLFGILSQSVVVLIFNIPFIDLKLVGGQALAGQVSFDLVFLLVILVSLGLTYIGIKQRWQDWKRCGVPFVILAGLLGYLIVYPTSLPLYHGLVEMIPTYDYLKIVGYDVSFVPIFEYIILVSARALSFLFLGFLLSALIEKKHYLINSYDRFSAAESETAVSFFLSIAIGFLLTGLVFQSLLPELMLLFYSMFNVLFFIVGVMSFVFLLIVAKDHSLELWYYLGQRLKEPLSPARFLGRMIQKKKLNRWHSWPQLGYLVLVGVVALGLSLSMVKMVSPPQETIAFENASESIRVREFMSIDGENYSYGWFGFIDVQDYVSVHLKVLSNDTVGFYLRSDDFVSAPVLVEGPGNETVKEYTGLTPDRYQVIYYIALDDNGDEEATIYMNVLRTPRKSYLIGPETLPLLIIWALFFIRPSYILAKMK